MEAELVGGLGNTNGNTFMKKKIDKKFRNPVWTVRLEVETVMWLKEEKTKYKSWNLFFKQLKKTYAKNKL